MCVIKKKLPPRVLQKRFDAQRADAGDKRFKQLIKSLKQERRQVEQMFLQRLEVEVVPEEAVEEEVFMQLAAMTFALMMIAAITASNNSINDERTMQNVYYIQI